MIRSAYFSLTKDQQRYLYVYTVLVLLITFFGGTDFFRFATFLFLAQVILIGNIADNISGRQIEFMLISMFVFNRIWIGFPDWDVDRYRYFYGGFSLLLNIATIFRRLECSRFLLVRWGLRKRKTNLTSHSPNLLMQPRVMDRLTSMYRR